jgi:hypothetical protein
MYLEENKYLFGTYKNFWEMLQLKYVRTYQCMKVTVFRDVAMSIALMMEAVSTSETCVSFYQTTQCNIPEESTVHCRENL